MRDDGWTAVGKGGRTPVLDGMRWRSVRWCEGRPLAGFDVVVGDPSVVALAEPDAFVVAVRIDGQDMRSSCGPGRLPDLVWEADRAPLHPWGGRTDLPTRGDLRARWAGQGWDGEPLVSVLAPSWARLALSRLVVAATSPAHRVVVSTSPEDFAGADFVVCSAGWGPVWEARWSRVPYAAVHLGDRDHDARANCRPDDLPGLLAGVVPVDLPDSHRPVAPDYRPELRRVIAERVAGAA
jgi:hypothetical protein